MCSRLPIEKNHLKKVVTEGFAFFLLKYIFFYRAHPTNDLSVFFLEKADSRHVCTVEVQYDMRTFKEPITHKSVHQAAVTAIVGFSEVAFWSVRRLGEN